MKLLITTGIFPPEIGGPATYAKLLYDRLPESGIAVSVLTYGASRGPSVYAVSYRWPKGLRHLIYFVRLLWLARRHDAVLAADASFGGGFIPALARPLLGRKFIVRVTGDYAWEQGAQRFGVRELLDEFQAKKKTYAWPVRLLAWAQTYTVRRADLVIAPSKYLKRIVMGWGVDGGRVNVIYNAFEPPRVEMSKDEAKERHALSGRTIIAVGRLVPWKGFDMLIRIWPELQPQLPGWRFIIVGDGPEMDKLKKQNKELHAGVELIGRLPKEKLLEYLRAADVFVLDTAYEGLSHQLLEAMSMGLPVVSTNIGGNPEIVRDNRDGYLLPYNDEQAFKEKIREMCRNSELRERMGESAKSQAGNFTSRRMIEEIIDTLIGSA